MRLVLHSYWRSSASYRVRIGLGLKKLSYEYIAINLLQGEQLADTYRSKNPIAQVPTLEITDDDGDVTTLTQSLAILEYLEEVWPEPPVLPRHPFLRARARALAEIVNAGTQPLANLATLKRVKTIGGDEAAWAKPFIAEGLAAFDAVSDEVSGMFCVGDYPTIADCCLVPQLLSARRFQIDLAPYERLLAIESRCLQLPAFADAIPHHQPDAVKS